MRSLLRANGNILKYLSGMREVIKSFSWIMLQWKVLMINIKTYKILIIFFSQLLVLQEILSQNRPDSIPVVDEKQLILNLQNIDPDVRKQSADQIKILLIKNQNAVQKDNIIEHQTQYWQDKILKYGPVMKKEEFEKVFLNKKTDFIPHYANVKFFQLDHFHLLRTRVSKKKVRLYNLTINPVFC